MGYLRDAKEAVGDSCVVEANTGASFMELVLPTECERHNRLHSCVRGRLAPELGERIAALSILGQAAAVPEKVTAGCGS